MNNLSKSPERGSFQRKGHEEKLKENPNDEHALEMIKMYNTWAERATLQEQDPEWQKDNMEYDMRTCDWMLEKVRNNDVYAQNLYAAMCNRDFVKHEVIPILKKQTWSCSWRYAGGIIADMQQKGDYIDWYCSGIRGGMSYEDDLDVNLVPEGTVTEEIREDLFRLGWIVLDEDEE